MITAFVLVTVEPGRVGGIAQEFLAVPGVTEVYSVAGPFDLVVVVRVREHEELSDLVTSHLATLAGIERTETLIAFRAYSRKDLGAMWDIGVD